MSENYQTLIEHKALVGLFAYNMEVYASPFDAGDHNALHLAHICTSKTTFAEIAPIMAVCSKLALYAGTHFGIAAVYTDSWADYVGDFDGEKTLADLPELKNALQGVDKRSAYFIVSDRILLRGDKVQELRDTIPSLFDLWRDNEPEDKAATMRMIECVSCALAGLEISAAEALELVQFLQHWNAE